MTTDALERAKEESQRLADSYQEPFFVLMLDFGQGERWVVNNADMSAREEKNKYFTGYAFCAKPKPRQQKLTPKQIAIYGHEASRA